MPFFSDSTEESGWFQYDRRSSHGNRPSFDHFGSRWRDIRNIFTSPGLFYRGGMIGGRIDYEPRAGCSIRRRGSRSDYSDVERINREAYNSNRAIARPFSSCFLESMLTHEHVYLAGLSEAISLIDFLEMRIGRLERIMRYYELEEMVGTSYSSFGGMRSVNSLYTCVQLSLSCRGRLSEGSQIRFVPICSQAASMLASATLKYFSSYILPPDMHQCNCLIRCESDLTCRETLANCSA